MSSQQMFDILLLVDSSVVGYESIIGAAKENVAVVVFDAAVDTFETLLAKVAAKGATAFGYVGLVQHGSVIRFDYSIVRTVAPALLSDVAGDMASWLPIVNFFKGLKEAYGVSVIDLISCDLYGRPEWRDAINKLEVLAGLKLRASSDATGNLANGATGLWKVTM